MPEDAPPAPATAPADPTTVARSNTVVPRPRPAKQAARETFDTFELAIVLSHFDIGVVTELTPFARGSRKSPKLVIDTDTGRYLLKRRARGRNDPYKVAFCHQLQLYLADKQFPLPHLIGTRRDNNSLLQHSGAIYELFEFIPGKGFPQTLEATHDAGRVQALYHKLLDDFDSEYDPPRGSYHKAGAVIRGIKAIRGLVPDKPDWLALLAELDDAYAGAAANAETIGLNEWPDKIVHGDWHPGNLLFREDHVVAVIDFDSARRLPRVIDAANGALQFSILGGGDDVSTWPNGLDKARYKRFLHGYDSVNLLSKAELRAVPWLMLEALVAEAVFPIAATGSFGRLDGEAFLDMVRRKTRWLQAHADELVEIVTD